MDLHGIDTEPDGADGGGTDFQAVEEIEGHSKKVNESGADGIGVAENGDVLIRELGAPGFQLSDHAGLDFEHQFSVGGACATSKLAKALPFGSGFEVGDE